MRSEAPFGAGLIILSSFFYASYGIWTKLMGNFFNGYTATVFRSTLVLVILIVIAKILKSFEPLKFNKNWQWIAGMLIASIFTWGTFYYAILHSGISVSLSVTYASTVIGMLLFGGVISNLFVVVALHKAWPSFTWHVEWLYLVLFAFTSVVASWTFIKGLKLIEAGAAGILDLTEIAFGVMFGVVFFNEKPGIIVLLGIAVIVLATAVSYIRSQAMVAMSITKR